jgi:hypothetical protein
MALRSESIAILQVFLDKGCVEADIIQFNDFGSAIVWADGCIIEEGMRSGFQELVEGKYVTEYSAGLGITARGLNEIVTG